VRRGVRVRIARRGLAILRAVRFARQCLANLVLVGRVEDAHRLEVLARESPTESRGQVCAQALEELIAVRSPLGALLLLFNDGAADEEVRRRHDSVDRTSRGAARRLDEHHKLASTLP